MAHENTSTERKRQITLLNGGVLDFRLIYSDDPKRNHIIEVDTLNNRDQYVNVGSFDTVEIPALIAWLQSIAKESE